MFRKLLRNIAKIFFCLIFLSWVAVLLMRWVNPPITPLMVSRVVEGASINKKWTDIENISPYMVYAAIASEDNNFLGHKGFDKIAIQKALDEYESGQRKRLRGASTISQQTAKNVFLWHGRSWFRKALEVYFTLLIEMVWGKERIMEVYLNVIETGNGIYGVEAAAKKYFNTSAKNLSEWQSALITACYPNPRMRNPARPTQYVSNRASQIVRLIPKIGNIEFSKDNIDKARVIYKKSLDKR